MKKLTSLLLTLTLALSLLAVPASALTYGDWEYTIQNNEVYLTKYIGSGGDVKVPSALNGVPVTKINFGTFTNNKNAETIYVPSSVKEIEEMAFQGCVAREITIAEGCTTIGYKAFRLNDHLEKINIPSTVTEMGYELISGCPSLHTVILAEGITVIPEDMCRDCPSLKTIRLPSTLRTIGKYAFGSTYLAGSGLTRIDIPSSVTTVEPYAFTRCFDLEEVNFLGNQVKTIGDGAFSDTGIEHIYLPTSVTKLGMNVFDNCDRLTGVVLPYGINSIGNAVFKDCDNLTWVSAPSTLRDIRNGNFGSGSPNMIVYTPAGSAAVTACQKWETPYLTDASADSTIQVIYDGQRISFGAYGQNPTIINNRTMVPLRSIFEAMGADVSWDNATRTALGQRDGTSISIAIGSNLLYVNGRAVSLDSPACIINNRTMVPVRAIAEAFRADVDWDNPSRTVIIEE